MLVRVQKFLADQGFGSRREVERWIVDKRLKVDGQFVELGCKVSGSERFSLDGKVLRVKGGGAEGEVCTRRDPEGRPTVFRRLPKLKVGRWVSVGRLDVNSSGLLLFTNDGGLANRLMHPKFCVEREYAVRVFGVLSDKQKRLLCMGVELDDGFAQFQSVAEGGGTGANRWYHVVLSEGRYREVRRLFAFVGLTVSRLIRVRYGDLKLPPRLRSGEVVELEEREVFGLLGDG